MKTMMDNRSVFWYVSGILALLCIVLVSGCTAPSSPGSLPGSSSGLAIGSSANVGGLDVTVTNVKIADVSPFAATYKKNTGKDLPPSKTFVAAIRISNPGSAPLELGRTGAYSPLELRAGDGTKYTLSPQSSPGTYTLKPGEQTSFTIYGDVGNNGTDTTQAKLKQHAELVLLKIEGDKVTGDTAKWDVTPVFNG